MKTVAVGEFKTHCLSLLERVKSKKEKIIVTRRGKPIAQVIPLKDSSQNLREELRGTLIFEGDLISPIDEAWEAMK